MAKRVRVGFGATPQVPAYNNPNEKEKHMSNNQNNAASMEAYLNEYVAVKLFRDNDRYKDDVYVAVNGHNCVIKRGEWVKIKRKFALVLEQSEIQDMQTADMLEAEQSRFLAAEEARA